MDGKERSGRYEMNAPTFHCDHTGALQVGHLGNYMLNAADYHATERGFGWHYLKSINKAWVLSRLCIEMTEMPKANEHFYIETWLESVKRYFTYRNFRIEDAATGKVMGHACSVWALIDSTTRQPVDLMEVNEGDIATWVNNERHCDIAPPGRARMTDEARLAATVTAQYTDIDVNGHVNSMKYIEHILNLFPMEWHEHNRIRRFDVAYVAEAYCGDRLDFFTQTMPDGSIAVKITRTGAAEVNKEVVRCVLVIDN